MFPATGCSSPTSPVRSIPPISMERTSATSSTPRAISLASPMPKSNKAHRRNDMTDTKPIRRLVVPLEGAGGKLTSTNSSPIQVHGVTKVPARRAPDLGEHDKEILSELG